MGNKKKYKEIKTARDVARIDELVHFLNHYLVVAVNCLRADKLSCGLKESANLLAARSFIRMKHLVPRINHILEDNPKLKKTKVGKSLSEFIEANPVDWYAIELLCLENVCDTLHREVENHIEERLQKELKESEDIFKQGFSWKSK